jgi:hypothetical protein
MAPDSCWRFLEDGDAPRSNNCPVLLFIVAAASVAGCLPRDKDVGRTRPESKAASEATGPKRAKDRPAPLAASAATLAARAPKDPVLAAEFSDNFDGASLGDHWRATSDAWRIEAGRVCAASARNHPLWLAKRLPVNARIEFDAISTSTDGDLKAEFWGDGSSAASQTSYTNATSYLTIFGGWKNRFHVLARIDEHAAGRPERRLSVGAPDFTEQPVVPERTYRFKVERQDGKTVIWWVDDVEILRYADDAPLKGLGHEHFAFNNWEVRTCFDNLRVSPLSG